MINIIDIKRRIGEWIEQNQTIENASEIFKYYCNGEDVTISMEKSNINPYIVSKVVTYTFVYRFIYKGSSKSPFDMSKLEHINTTKIEDDD